MTTITAPISLHTPRPKVGRLPALCIVQQPKKLPLPGFLLFWAVMLAVLITVSISMRKEPVITAATTLPPVAVVSDRIKSDTLGTQANKPAMMDSVNVLSVGDAQAATGYVLPKPGSTITLQDKSGSIIGQMAKIPMESEPITEVKPIQNLDKGSKRELLSIISKY